MIKVKLLFALSILLLSSSINEDKKIPPLDIEKFGKIIGIWEKNDPDNKKVLYVITDKNVLLETKPNDYSTWRDLETTEVPNLSKVGENTFVFKFLWDSDWNYEWNNLEEDEKKIYKDANDLRMRSSWYYVIGESGDLSEGAYATYKNAPDKLIIHNKYN